MAEYKVVRVDANGSATRFVEEREALRDMDVELVGKNAVSEDELIAALSDADAAVTAGARFTRRVFESLPRLLAVIRTGVGYDTIDVQAATDNGVMLINNPAPAWCAEEVSNQAMLLMMGCAKKVAKLHALTTSGRWREAQAAVMPCGCLHGQTAGLIGCGGIGRAIVRKTQALLMDVVVYDPYLSSEDAARLNVRPVSLEQLLQIADYVLVQTPLTDETYHMLGAEQFAMMKPGAMVINCARGECVDESALIAALQEGRIAGAGLDVFENEPPRSDHPLFGMDNVLVSPHCASWSTVAFQTMNRTVGQQIALVLRGERPTWLVNRDVRQKEH